MNWSLVRARLTFLACAAAVYVVGAVLLACTVQYLYGVIG